MTEYITLKIPVAYLEHIDPLVERGVYASRVEYVKELIRQEMAQRVRLIREAYAVVEDVQRKCEDHLGDMSQEEVVEGCRRIWEHLNAGDYQTSELEAMIVNGFINPIVRELPLEYAVEMNRLIEMEMENSVG